MQRFSEKFKATIQLFFLLSIVLLFSGFYYLYTEVSRISDILGGLRAEEQRGLAATEVPDSQAFDSYTKDEVEKLIADAIATLSAEPSEKVVEKTTVVTKSAGTTYIPMGTTGETTSTGWVDVDDSSVYIDVENDYGPDAKVSWEASLKVAHGNGQAFARLYDDTHNIGVDFSEISATNNVDFEQVSSGNLPFWKGRNLYKVQIKSLNSFKITYSGGKIKVSY